MNGFVAVPTGKAVFQTSVAESTNSGPGVNVAPLSVAKGLIEFRLRWAV